MGSYGYDELNLPTVLRNIIHDAGKVQGCIAASRLSIGFARGEIGQE